MARETSKTSLAEEVWQLMFDYLMRTAPHRTQSLAKRGLTPNDSRALFSLAFEAGRTMRSLADAWQCDPSNATWIVDRLEQSGLVKRQAAPHDRRVKLVVLTPKGQKTRAELMKEFYQPPPDLIGLDRDDLEALLRILRKLTGSTHTGDGSAFSAASKERI